MAKIQNIPSLSRTAHALIVTGLLLFLLAGTVSLAQAAPPRQNASNGEAIFKAKCAACHTIGGGKLVGPDLKDVTTLRDTAWISAWIQTPDKMLASGDPIALQMLAEYNNIPMPNLGISDAEVADLLAYFKSAPQAGGQSSYQLLNGDPDYGEKIFTGNAPLMNGGMPCIACHSVSGVETIGGGLGPDLTQVYARYGQNGLTATLGSLPFPTMQNVFANKPLINSEQADLLAFFARSAEQSEARTQSNLQIILGIGFGITAILLFGMLFFWPRQYLSLAQRLRKNGKL